MNSADRGFWHKQTLFGTPAPVQAGSGVTADSGPQIRKASVSPARFEDLPHRCTVRGTQGRTESYAFQPGTGRTQMAVITSPKHEGAPAGFAEQPPEGGGQYACFGSPCCLFDPSHCSFEFRTGRWNTRHAPQLQHAYGAPVPALTCSLRGLPGTIRSGLPDEVNTVISVSRPRWRAATCLAARGFSYLLGRWRRGARTEAAGKCRQCAGGAYLRRMHRTSKAQQPGQLSAPGAARSPC